MPDEEIKDVINNSIMGTEEQGILTNKTPPSLDELIKLIKRTIKDNIFFIDLKNDRNKKKKLAQKILHSFEMPSFWWGAIPIPLLDKYLEFAKNKKRNASTKKNNEENYCLDNLYIFVSVLNLFNEKYSNKITREFAETKILVDEELYQQNSNKIEKFIELFNKLQKSEYIENKNKKIIFDNGEYNEDNEDEIEKEQKIENVQNDIKEDKDYLKLNSSENYLADILIDPENKYGKIYISIFQKFIEKQNNELSNLLEKKIAEGKVDSNGNFRINIQRIKENEIFTFIIEEYFYTIVFSEIPFQQHFFYLYFPPL